MMHDPNAAQAVANLRKELEVLRKEVKALRQRVELLVKGKS